MLNGLIEINMIMTFLEILMDEKSSDAIKDTKLKALKELGGNLAYYAKKGYITDLITTIAEKKINMIKKATSKAEVDKILKPQFPYYNGNRFVPDKYSVPEEELICWSEASMIAPLNDVAFQRYMELFRDILPEQSKLII